MYLMFPRSMPMSFELLKFLPSNVKVWIGLAYLVSRWNPTTYIAA